MRPPTRFGIAAVAAGTLAGILVSPTAASAASSRTTLPGSVPSWANSKAFKGAAPTGDAVGFRLYLRWRNAAAADKVAHDVSTPGTASYHHFLTPAQFRQQFAPTQSDVTKIQQWLRSSGFTVDYTPSNNLYVAAEGTVAQANAAFATTLGRYAYSGLTLRAPERALSVPSTLPAVAAVAGLDDSAALVHTDHVVADATPSAGFRNAAPLSAYWDEKNTATTPTPDATVLPGSYPFAQVGHAGAELEKAYNVYDSIQAGNDGTGVTVGIIDAYASPTIVTDSSQYFVNHGLPAWKNNQFTQVVAPGTFHHPEKGQKQDPQGWYGEESLDVEAVHTMAPGANVVFVGAPNNFQDLDAAMNHIVDRHLADIVSNSYGWGTEALPPGFIIPFESILVQAAAEGIGVYFSSGDGADETDGTSATNYDAATPDWPATSPYVTAVGGTSLAVGQNATYLFETGWETVRQRFNRTTGAWGAGTLQYGSGGGTSRLFAQPSYQAGVVPAAIATAHGNRAHAMRTVPDVAMVGDPNTGMLIGQTQAFPDGNAYGEYRIGGTSLSCPLFAGLMAVAQQLKGSDIGFANPALYAAGTSAYRDVVSTADTLATQTIPSGEDWTAVARSDYINTVDASDGYSYSLRHLGDDVNLTIHAVPGYDDVTGVGTPSAAFLATIG